VKLSELVAMADQDDPEILIETEDGYPVDVESADPGFRVTGIRTGTDRKTSIIVLTPEEG
jgi:hypothetical protein